MTTASPARTGRQRRRRWPEGFPTDFVWGAATAAYQIEGAVDRGRPRRRRSGTPSRARPAGSRNGDTGDVACDHYHRYRDDVGADGATSGSAPTGSRSPGRGSSPTAAAPANPRGPGLLRPAGRRAARRRASTPWVTLYHWDLPQALEDAGGWPARDTADRFAELRRGRGRRARRPGRRTGPRSTSRGARRSSATARHARARARRPRRRRCRRPPPAARRTGWPSRRSAPPRPTRQVGITLNLYPVDAGRRPTRRPSTPRAGSTACTTGSSSTRCCRGSYPADVLADLGPLFDRTAWSATATSRRSRTPLDFLGVNYYTRHNVRGSAYPGSDGAEFVGRGLATHRHGLGDRPRRAGRGAHPGVPRLHAAAALRHRERRGLADEVGAGRLRRRPRPRWPTSPPTSRRLHARDRAGCRLAATSPGRCSTTSSGPRATPSGSAWSTSTTPPSGGRQGQRALVRAA